MARECKMITENNDLVTLVNGMQKLTKVVSI